ncbi:30S ribosomal protein S16 [Chlamydiales bacterium SCGC AG-110-P3]|nr:30S ribosomal protein S16 [Chlamydiales bacterium SCGC AG-110-P3]
MALTIRLRQQGRKGHQQFRLVLTDNRTRRDGKYIEMLGWYDPAQAEDEKNLLVKADRVQHWIEQGAQLSETVETLVRRAAPAVLRARTEREIAKRATAQAKRRTRRKAAAK